MVFTDTDCLVNRSPYTCMVGCNNCQLSIINYQLCFERTSGGYCGRVPPLPIPNREVKPACADGTAMQCGRVGSRLLSNRELQNYSSEALFFVLGETGNIGETGM